jgi:hypothetical protein
LWPLPSGHDGGATCGDGWAGDWPLVFIQIEDSLRGFRNNRRMKVIALVAGLLVGGWYIDKQYSHGYYFRAVSSLAQQIATSFGLRR